MPAAPPSPGRLLQATVALAALMLAPSLHAQPSRDVECRDVLGSAELRYTEGAYDAVEALVLECISHSEATAGEQIAGHRLLALSFIKRDLMVEAQGEVIKILSLDYGYEPDRLLDLPLYVALVDVVKDQLRIGPRMERLAVAPSIPSAAPAVARADVAPATALRVDVNTATAEALDAVPGIGPAIAGRILAYRTQNGPFRSVAELEAVRGIGPRTLERMAPYLTAGRSAPSTMTTSAGGGVPSVTAPVVTVSPATAPRVNLNTATADELETLIGIGPALAARIVEFRTLNGPFRSVSDVVQVRGIGPATLEGFAPQVTVE